MIKDAEDGKIDMILTKSISRFARNTVNTLKYVRLLKAKNVPILDFRSRQPFYSFELQDNKNTKTYHESVRVRFEIEKWLSITN